MRILKATATGAVVLATTLLLAACGAESGTVVSKDHSEAYTTTTQQCASFNPKGICTVWVPSTQYHPESWSVSIKNDQGEKGTWDVSESEYEAIQVGDHYSRE